jgi:hypothetical protein
MYPYLYLSAPSTADLALGKGGQVPVRMEALSP